MSKSSKNSKRIGKVIIAQCLPASYALAVLSIIYFACLSFNSFLERQKLEMESVAYEIESSFSSTLDQLESILNSVNHKVANSGGDKEKISKILKSFSVSESDHKLLTEELSGGMFFWINNQEMMVMSSDYGLVKTPIDVSKRDYLKNTKQTPWKIFAGVPTIGAATGQYVIPAGVGVVDAKNNYLGTSAVGLKVDKLLEKFSHFADRYKVSFAIIDSQNAVLIGSNPKMFLQDNGLLKNITASSDYNVQETVLDFKLTSPKDYHVISRKFGKYPYLVLIGAKNEAVAAGAFQEMMPHLIELLIITTFFATILLLIRKVLKY
ncbi:MAG: hypothetical protein EBS06_01885 [Proteobacteria bacterium]|nr:hypothetical protein [Pseudomonadota bacterium]